MKSLVHSIAVLLVTVGCACQAAEVAVPEFAADVIDTFQTSDARQGVAVDAGSFYATNNYRITRHDKTTGAPLLQWDGGGEGDVLIHLDSLMERDGRLYAAHSNYGGLPMTSSVEIWDAETLEHVGTHSFGVNRGSFTWLDWHDGHWWGAFANYDKIQRGQRAPYGETRNTQIVKMDDGFSILQSWVLPEGILDRIRPMSNSGGSWGPDGYLYLTGHDHGEIYVMEIPKAGSTLHWAATVTAPAIEGQGIAWDRSIKGRELWGILKRDRLVVRLKMPSITTTRPQAEGTVRTDALSQ